MHPEPIATYRLQLNSGFRFEHAWSLIPYLSMLGISHLYTSPFLQAVKGSSHGYDTVDHTSISSELGGYEELLRLSEYAKSYGLRFLIDVVPNHMAIKGRENPWWWDVLENGPSSPYAKFFDVDWLSSEERWPNKVLIPILSDHYGRILENGQLKLSYRNGSIFLHYQEHIFPIDPSSLPEFLNKIAESCHTETMGFIAESYQRLPKPSATSERAMQRRHRDKNILGNMLCELCQECAEVKIFLENELEKLNQDFDALDKLICQQNYRLAFWRTANQDLGYRRFFDIKDLIALRIEDQDVFQETHQLIFDLIDRDVVHGLRIDHPDGLRDPQEYFERLKKICANTWIVAEKILQYDERLPISWPIDGTTGYDFLNVVNAAFINSESEYILNQFYEEFLGKNLSYDEVVYESKLEVLSVLFVSELNRLTAFFIEICEKHRRHRDYTRKELYDSLKTVAACFTVYRTYVRDKNVTPEDGSRISEAINLAIQKRTDLDIQLFEFLKHILLMRFDGTQEKELALRFQQLTSSVMAKGFEDTALYRYNRFIALNEVGSNPKKFGISLQEFHHWCQNHHKSPLSLLATSTHDSKWGEDCRARLSLLSEIPQDLINAIQRWSSINKKHACPDRNTEYLFYQTLIGSWPIEEIRMQEYLQKSIREAKENTTWTKPNKAYEESVNKFISSAMQDQIFLEDFQSFISKIHLPGMLNGLSQTLIKLTTPGIPDFYQGCELWNRSLVDPDNRKPIDFTQKKEMMEKLLNIHKPEELMEHLESGLPKMYIIQKVLKLRKDNPQLFSSSAQYHPLYAKGQKKECLIAYMRGDSAITLAPRYHLKVNGNWENTNIELPRGKWQMVFIPDSILEGDNVEIKMALRRFPVCLLHKIE